MAKGKETTLVKVKLNNSKTETTVNKVVEYVVVDNKLVIDNNDLNPGVKQ